MKNTHQNLTLMEPADPNIVYYWNDKDEVSINYRFLTVILHLISNIDSNNLYKMHYILIYICIIYIVMLKILILDGCKCASVFF